MKKFLALLLALTMALALVACGGGDDAASDTTADSGDDAAASTGEFEEMTWKFACSATETSPWVDGAKEFARIVGEKTGGAITVQYYPADQLTAGNQTDGIQALMDGTTELSMHSNLIWSSFDQRFNVVSLPFLFSSTEEADAALDGAGGEALGEIMDYAYRSFTAVDAQTARRIEPVEEVVDDMVATLRTNHIRRLRDGQCTVYAGLVFLDILINAERIADQCSNLGVYTISQFDPSVMNSHHEYIHRLHQGNDPVFNREYQEKHEKYFGMLSAIND